MTDEELTPLAQLERAVQEFVNATAGHARVVTGSVVVFSMAPSISLTVGLLEVGRDRVLSDVKGYRARDDDE